VHDEGGLDGGNAWVSYLGGEVKLCIRVVCIDGAAVYFKVYGEFFMVWVVWWNEVQVWLKDGGREVSIKTINGVVDVHDVERWVRVIVWRGREFAQSNVL